MELTGIVERSPTTEDDFESRWSRLESSPSASLRKLRGSAEDLDRRIADQFGSVFPSWLGLEPGQTLDSFTQEITEAIQQVSKNNSFLTNY